MVRHPASRASSLAARRASLPIAAACLFRELRMLVQGARPRQLRWFHSGPMLFGDWGTSRLYVLGLAMFYAGHASFWFMLAMSFLLVGVGWSYQIICRLYPDGGGVYSSARHRSQTLAVIGAL